METLYRKVAVSERLPKINGNYFTDKYRSFYFSQEVNKFMDDEGDFIYPKYWLEEITNPTAQLKADKVELLEALEKAYEYLEEIGMVVPNKEWTEQFRDRWNRKLTEIESLIQKMKQ